MFLQNIKYTVKLPSEPEILLSKVLHINKMEIVGFRAEKCCQSLSV